jgi:phenylacetate-CoA ligase
VLRDGRPAEPGEHGELVATALHSFAMPFIRYAVGDMVTRGAAACVCGQPFGTIRQVQGRMIDYFVLPNGGLVHPYQLTMGFLGVAPWIREYQLVQERTDRVVLRIVAFTPPSAEQTARVRQVLSQRLGSGVDVDVMVVSEIALAPSGKLRPSRSLVRSEYDGMEWDSASSASP